MIARSIAAWMRKGGASPFSSESFTEQDRRAVGLDARPSFPPLLAAVLSGDRDQVMPLLETEDVNAHAPMPMLQRTYPCFHESDVFRKGFPLWYVTVA